MYEGTCTKENFFAPGKLTEKQILRTHDEQYWSKLKACGLSRAEERKTGFPLSPELVEREITICQGTLDNCRYAKLYFHRRSTIATHLVLLCDTIILDDIATTTQGAFPDPPANLLR